MARSESPPAVVIATFKGETTTRPEQEQNSESSTSSERAGTRVSTPEFCPECSGALVAEGDETVCADCGLIVAVDRIDRGPEWRRFSDRDSGHHVHRCNGNPNSRTFHDKGLGSILGHDESGPQLARMRKLQTRARFNGKVERNRAHAFGAIKRVVSTLDLPQSVTMRACELFTQSQEADLIRGRSVEAFVGGVVYAACREQNLARLPAEIGKCIQLDQEDLGGHAEPSDAITNTYSLMCREFGLTPKPPVAADYIPRASTLLDVSPETRAQAITLARLAEGEQAFVGNAPSGIAAACLYLAGQATGEYITQATAGEALNVTPVTVRNAQNILLDLDSVDNEGETTSPRDIRTPPERAADESPPTATSSSEMAIESASEQQSAATTDGRTHTIG